MTHRPRLLPAAAAVAAAALLASACGSGTPADVGSVAAAGGDSRAGNILEQARASGTLRVSNTQANPPYSFVDESNQVVGFDVDVAREVAKRMGIEKVEFIPGTFQTFIPGLQAGKWDAVISGLTITDERKAQVEFSCPYQVNEVSIFVAAGTQGIGGEQDLSGRRVAVSAGSTQEKQVREIEGTKVLTYNNSTLALRDVATGRADAYVGSKFTGAYLAKKNDLNVGPTAGFLSRENNAMAFPKGQTELADAADQALDEMIADGTLSELSRKWLGGLDVVESLKELPEC